MGMSSVDVPHRYVPRWQQQTYSSTHKVSLAMVLFWTLQWWKLDVSSSVYLGGAGWRPLATVVARNPKYRFVQIQDDRFILVYILVFTCVASCNLIFN
jgi:hypothetical protein